MIHAPSKNKGQVLPYAILGLTIACAVLLLMYNTGQKITDKTVVANAADAAAYSAGVWTSRHLNFMAYTNRGMIANHVGVGHFVSYVGWIRYVRNSANNLQKVAGWIPYVGQVISAVRQVADGMVQAAESTARGGIPATEILNNAYFTAQVEAQAGLTYFRLNRIMEETARVYDPDIRVNELSNMSGLPPQVRAVLTTRITAQRARIPAFVETFKPGRDDNGEISALVQRSYGPSQRWIAGNRGWSMGNFFFKLRKTGSTSHQMNDQLTDWSSRDQLRLGTPDWLGWDWETLGKGKATAREFNANYRGINRYYNIREDNPSRVDGLYITVYAAKRQNQTDTKLLLPLSGGDLHGNTPLNATATALVAFKRPDEGFGARKEEYGSLYNPFWEPRLVYQTNVVGF